MIKFDSQEESFHLFYLGDICYDSGFKHKKLFNGCAQLGYLISR